MCQLVPNNDTKIIEVTIKEVVIHKKVGNFSFLIPGRMRKKPKKMVIIKIYITTLLISSMADVLFGSLYSIGPFSDPKLEVADSCELACEEPGIEVGIFVTVIGKVIKLATPPLPEAPPTKSVAGSIGWPGRFNYSMALKLARLGLNHSLTSSGPHSFSVYFSHSNSTGISGPPEGTGTGSGWLAGWLSQLVADFK